MGYEGKDVYPEITSEEEVLELFNYFSTQRGRFVVEEHIPGDYHRLYVVGDRVIYGRTVEQRLLVGDGHRSIEQLIEAHNQTCVQCDPVDPQYYNNLEGTKEIQMRLKRSGFTLETILPKNYSFKVRASLKLGKRAVRWYKNCHPHVEKMAIQAVKVVGVHVAAIDYIATDLSQPPEVSGGRIVEVQDNPDFLSRAIRILASCIILQ